MTNLCHRGINLSLVIRNSSLEGGAEELVAVEEVGCDALDLGHLDSGKFVDVEAVGEVDGAHVGDEA